MCCANKDKGKGRKVVAHVSSQVSTHSFTKTSVQRIVALATTVVGSPTATIFAHASDFVAARFHSYITIPLVPHKTKVVVPDTSMTLSERQFFD